MRSLAAVGVIVALLSASGVARADAPCTGTYVILGGHPLLQNGALTTVDAITLGDDGVAIRSGCTAAPFTAKHTRKGWRLRARWSQCGAFAKKLRLVATVRDDCRRLQAVVGSRRPKLRRQITATRTECGDGIVDGGNDETCEPAGVGTCGFDCQTITGDPLLCGNSAVDPGEECDDGNSIDDDLCTNACRRQCTAKDFPSTWAAIQTVVFERHGCTAENCHGAGTLQGNLDLRPDGAYQNLVNVASTADPLFLRLTQGDEDASLLYRKLRAGVTGTDDVPGGPMPSAGAPLSADELKAVRLWIRGGLSTTAVVEGTGTLLNTCLGASTPLKTVPPDPPAADQGVQLYAPPWTIPAHGESEVCFATYYDVGAQVAAARPDALLPCPPEWGGAAKQCFAFNTSDLTQDPNSHHSIIRAYRGVYDATDASFGPYTCHGGAQDGAPCNPLVVDQPAPSGAQCGERSACAGRVQGALACIGYGPPDFGFTTNVSGSDAAPTIGGSQSPRERQPLPPNVYRVLPVKGVIVWNSHAFNQTGVPTTNEQWLNLTFAGAGERQYRTVALADDSSIFAPYAEPFAAHEICRQHTFERGTRLFELSSHTHKRGVLFRIRDPDGRLIYTSTTYNDPTILRFDPPVALDATSYAKRTYEFCCVYDNGKTNPAAVKRRSTSPSAFIGGPCDTATVACIAGPKKGQLCNGNDAFCDSAPGAGDGDCDACPVVGGVTTEDEMFILLGGYYVVPPGTP